MNGMDYNPNDFNWTDKSVYGMALIIQGGSMDSEGNQIEKHKFYNVGKHKVTGGVVIIPSKQLLTHDRKDIN